jgi:hypothetical protein
MTDDFSAVFEAPLTAAPDLDELVRATMAWHFSPATGSPYWTGRAGDLGFDPLVDVKTFEDLRLFDQAPPDWSAIPADRLIPAGCRRPDVRFGVYESGGTTGAPKRIVDADARRRNVQWQSALLDDMGFPASSDGFGGWLHIGPTGPHVMAKNVTNLAAMRGFLPYYIDLDPRWVRRCLAQGRQDLFGLYVDHLLDQVKDVLATQDIRAISSTPRILERIAGRPDVFDLLAKKVRGVIWGGTSMSAETLRLLEHELLPEAVVAGAYGNTMMGVAPQRPRQPGDTVPCVFRPYFPYTVVEVVDPADPARPVPDGAAGQVRITVLTRDLFVPPILERDQAVRWTPTDGYAGLDVSDVGPLETGAAKVIEGVY